MTQPQAVPAAPQAPQRTVVTPQPGSRLETLLLQRDAAIARMAEAKEHLDSINGGIKAELTRAYPGVPNIDIAGGAHWSPLWLHWATRREFQTTAFKAAQPDLYNMYVQIKGRWELRAGS